MTITEPVRVLAHVSATVKSREDKGEDGYRIQLDIPSFKTKYPTVLNFVPSELAQKMVPNTAVNLVLVRDKLRQDANGKPYDGKWKWHYWWRLDSLWDSKQAKPVPATPLERLASTAEQVSQIEPESPSRNSWDDQTSDIEAAWAIDQAREWLQHRQEGWGENMSWLLAKAQQFHDAKKVLAAAIRSGTHLGQPQEPPLASPEAKPEPVPVVPALPASVGELLTRATKELGYPDRAAVFAVLGIQSAVELASPERLAPAWRTLVEKAPKKG